MATTPDPQTGAAGQGAAPDGVLERVDRRAPGVYVHVPFCRRVCPYCDFAVQRDDAGLHARFVDSLLREAEQRGGEIGAASTLYLGGGTPSALGPPQLERLLAGLDSRLAWSGDRVICLEANPEDVTPEVVAAWRALGVGMISLGVQSFDDEELRFLGRAHRGTDAETAATLCLEAGFPLVSIDLIFGLPGQERAALARRIDRALALETPHLSAYQLTIEGGTHFGRAAAAGRLAELPRADQADRFAELHQALAAGGLSAYEVSNFARFEAAQSPHNAKYWDHVPYLGLGPGAHAFSCDRRAWNPRSLADWQGRVARGEGPEESERLTPDQLALEAVFLGLRQARGLDLRAFAARFGTDLRRRNDARFASWREGGFLREDAEVLRLTVEGWAVSDALAAEIDCSADGSP